MSKKRVRLTVAYDGTAYHGWQVQPGVVTIESKLNECLSDLLREDIQVIGASRTDKQALYAVLKMKRKEIAEEEGVPPYMVFTDRTLLDMCVKAPSNKTEMLKVSGVGENKYARYGSQFLRCIEENYIS